MKYKLLVTKNGETTNAHIPNIQAGTTKYLFPNNVLTKKKWVMRQWLGQTCHYSFLSYHKNNTTKQIYSCHGNILSRPVTIT